MGNIALRLKLIKSSFLIQWRFTLLSFFLMSFYTTALLVIRYYEVVLSENASLICRIFFIASQLGLVVLLTATICRTAKSKVIGHISSLKALVIIGLGKKDILLCLIVDILLNVVLGLCLGIHCIFLLPLSESHEMLITPIEVVVIMSGMTGLSCFAVMYFFRQLTSLESEKC